MHPLQRQWDALLILHWRKDSRFGALAEQCETLLGKNPIALAKEGMLRCSAFAHPKMHVRVWVDSFLHPLGLKLWDIDDNKRMLDWLNASTGLDCEQSKKARQWQREGVEQSRRSHIHMKQLSLSIDIGKLHRRTGNPNQVKATGRKSGRK